MTDKNKVIKILFSVLGAGTMFFSVIGQVLTFLEDTNLSWLLTAIGAMALGGSIYWIMNKIEGNKAEEELRINSILEERAYFGEEFSEWLISKKIDIFESRNNRLLSKKNEWGTQRVQALIMEEISNGMTVEMVELSLGDPQKILYPEEDGDLLKWLYDKDDGKSKIIWMKEGLVVKTEV